MSIETSRRPLIGALVAAVTLTVPSVARADGPVTPASVPRERAVTVEPPSDGFAMRVAGGVLTFGGVAGLVALPVCTGFTDVGVTRPCLGVAALASAAFFAVGLPLLTLAEGRSHAFKDWQAAHPGVAGLGFSATRSTGALTWTARF